MSFSNGLGELGLGEMGLGEMGGHRHTVVEILSFKDLAVTTLTFWGHVTSSIPDTQFRGHTVKRFVYLTTRVSLLQKSMQ